MTKNKQFRFVEVIFIIIFLFTMLELSIIRSTSKKSKVAPKDSPTISDKEDFTFINYPPVRQIDNPDLGTNLSDIESHLPSGHHYSHQDLITWGHESTHGINANIRNAQPASPRINAFYCMRNRAVVLKEPATTITKVAKRVPSVLKGPSYDLYLKQQAAHWNDRPLYLLDEWVAYSNGVEVGREMNLSGWDYELLQAHNFCVYAICVAMEIQLNCPDYDDTAFSGFLKWNIERVMNLTRPLEDGPQMPLDRSSKYLEIVRTHDDAAKFRDFCRGYFGAEWCEEIYQF